MALRGEYRPDRMAAARAARQERLARYTRFVRVLRVALPIAALGAIAAIFIAGRERAGIDDLLSAEEIARLGAGLRLDEPRFAGTTDDGDPFTIRARTATPDGPLAQEIALDAPTGKLALANGQVLEAVATDGMMYRDEERLTLSGGVEITTSDGYRFNAPNLTLHLATKGAEANGRILGTGPQGSIEADKLTISGAEAGLSGARLYFEGSVRVLFTPDENG
ncbi:MAG: LPS export ABC transporter periplasmic protein LptC [Pseudomonadota bacterium]